MLDTGVVSIHIAVDCWQNRERFCQQQLGYYRLAFSSPQISGSLPADSTAAASIDD